MARWRLKITLCKIEITTMLVISLIFSSYGRDNRTFSCENGQKISISSLCNGVDDCSDGSDENYIGKGFKCKLKNRRNCVISPAMVFDDVIDCEDGSDLCFDDHNQLLGHKCFQCVNGAQVISLLQVCDGVIDCDDMSDECLCMNSKFSTWKFRANPMCNQICLATRNAVNSLTLNKCDQCNVGEIICSAKQPAVITNATTDQSSASNSSKDTLCISTADVCNGIADCPNGEDEMFCTKSVKCNDDTGTFATACDGIPTCESFVDECGMHCWNRPKYCDNLVDNHFVCSNSLSWNTTDNQDQSKINSSKKIVSNQICDNNIDCHNNGSDEAFCSLSTRFYCWGGEKLFVNWSGRFDGIQDCDDGSDECAGTYSFDVFKNVSFGLRNELIRNPFLQISAWIMAVFSLVGNSIVIVFTTKELWKDRRLERLGRLAKCNRTFVLNLAFADLLMGIHLLFIGIEGLIKSNNFCETERSWRSSRLCCLTGILAQTSSQTSIFILLLMTSYRLYGTQYPFKVEESRLIGGAALATTCSWIVSISLAIIPQISLASEYFLHQYWIPLPFVTYDIFNKEEFEIVILSLYSLTQNSGALLNDLRWGTMINYLHNSNVSSYHPQWNKNDVVPIGYYNRVPHCQPFYYSDVGDTAWLYMTIIIAFNFVAFAYIAIAYIIIYRNSSRPCVRKSVRRKSKQWRRDNRRMQKKVLLLVITDMACWVPICFLVLLKLCGVYLHPIVHGVTGTILLPINSAINPIIYSSISTYIKLPFSKKINIFREKNSSEISENDRNLQIRKTEVSNNTNASISCEKVDESKGILLSKSVLSDTTNEKTESSDAHLNEVFSKKCKRARFASSTDYLSTKTNSDSEGDAVVVEITSPQATQNLKLHTDKYYVISRMEMKESII